MTAGGGSVLVAIFVAFAGCSTPVPPRAPETPRNSERPFDRCGVALAVLDAIVRPNAEQPLGLEKACVEKYAALNGRTYVDVRFVLDGQIESVDESGCKRDGYEIRFDSEAQVPPPTETVVVLQIDRSDSNTIEFNALTEDRLWRQQHARHVYSWSPCLSALGVATFGPRGWHAVPKSAHPVP